MSSRLLCFSLVFGALFLSLTLTSLAHGQAAPVSPPVSSPPAASRPIGAADVHGAQVPESLVLRFDASASALDQPSIRAALAQELGMQLASDGSEQAATLTVAVNAEGDVQLSFRPTRETLTRSVPITSTSDVPRLIAQLAGNMVRNEADDLLAELRSADAAAAQAATMQSAATPVRIDVPTVNDTHEIATPVEAPRVPYLHDAWIFTVLGSLDWSLIADEPAYGNLMLQVSKRFDRFELGAGIRAAYGSMPVVARSLSADSPFVDSDDITGYVFAFPISAEYRLLGSDDAYLQLGVRSGMLLAGIMNQSASIASGSDVYVTLGLQATIGFQLGRNHGLVLRIGGDLLPASITIEDAHGAVGLDPLPTGVMLGWQIGG